MHITITSLHINLYAIKSCVRHIDPPRFYWHLPNLKSWKIHCSVDRMTSLLPYVLCCVLLFYLVVFW